MKRILRLVPLGLLLAAGSAAAQVLIQDPTAILYSTRSTDPYQRGVNSSDFRGAPAKTNTLRPLAVDGTRNQFRGVASFGALVRPRNTASLVTSQTYIQNAQNLELPRGTVSGAVTLVLRSAQVAAPYFNRLSDLNFGSVIQPPAVDRAGVLLTTNPAEYWEPEPFTPTNHDGRPYYWSPHARAVFATQPGPIRVTWRKRIQDANLTGTAGVDYTEIGGNRFALRTLDYIVSGASAKLPRKIYWTEKSFRATGLPIEVPQARVGAVYIHYNSTLPRNVSKEHVEPGDSSPAEGSTNSVLQELRTFWYDSQQGLILAYNREGRAFMELLGDPTGPNVRRHLGYEIVDVIKQPIPTERTVDLGEKLTAFSDSADDGGLQPSPLLGAISRNFLYQQAVDEGRLEYYAVKETENPNDVLVHWLESGVESLRWPALFARYRQAWPEDPARYSHYVRPVVQTEAEARQTAIPLPSDNAPAIQYQDTLDRARAVLTPEQSFYTYLDARRPIHRTLLRFNAGPLVAFERVLSSLSSELYRPGRDLDVSTGVNPSRPGRAAFLNFDGATGYGELPSRSYFGTNGFTVESWVYVRSHQNWQRLIDFGNGAENNNVILALGYGLTGRIHFSVRRPGATTVGLETDDALALRTWVHVAVVQSAPAAGATTAMTRIYVNGVEKKSATLNVPLDMARTSNFVGRSNWPDALLQGGIDDIRIWSVARSAAEIAQGMSVSGFSPGTSGLLAQFGFDQPGPVAYDSSGNGVHMSLRGLALFGTDPSNAATAGSGLRVPDRFAAPRYVETTATVGDRIPAPPGELGSAAQADYLPGYIAQVEGDSFHPTAYLNPLSVGFEAAARGAIIPVNAIPGRDRLEVWWFRGTPENARTASRNADQGFKSVLWPSVIGRYRLAWPSPAPYEIILASNAGSGALDSLLAKGSIYTQNDPALPGFNPNEEHALMIGGQAYALRDDLNITSGAGYSSQPFVLLDYTAEDGRPAIRPYRVLREKPDSGILFDYVVEAGTRLQAPMPLPLLPPPVEFVTNGAGESLVITATNYNQEPRALQGDLPVGWTPGRDEVGPYAHYPSFTFKDRKDNHWVLRGMHAGLPELRAGQFVAGPPERWETNLSVGVTALQRFTNYIHTSRLHGSLVTSVSGAPLPNGVSFRALPQGLAVFGTAPATSRTNTLVITDGDGATATVQLALLVGSTKAPIAPLRIVSPNAYAGTDATYVGRPPRLADSPSATNSFTMRFYYKTEDSFAWPGVQNPPAPGSIVPYLRPAGSTADKASKLTASLDIVYRPVWPGNAPKVDFGETLTVPSRGRPAVRGQTSARVLYQQSIANAIAAAPPAVVLHDPTRSKSFDLGTGATSLAKIPEGVRTESYRGKLYFPMLPPHLAQRFYLDPNRGTAGSLMFIGEFKDEALGEKYVLLNVLRGQDLATVKGLCPAADPDKSKWDAAIDGLVTTVETFYENPRIPGQFIVNNDRTFSGAVGELVTITDDNTAVDSYALSAAGPGQGFVTLIVGNGGAATPAGEPVSMYVLRVTGDLYRGELKILASANPLNELVSFQHTADLGGRFDDYEYEWKIAPPVDGFPPRRDSTMSFFQALVSGASIPRYTLGGSGVQVLGDNYVVMRYRPTNAAHPLRNQWSAWTDPVLAEGWIKRVLAGINPFGQRVTDLFNNTVNADASVLVQAGRRYEGDIALNLENINNYGLIEIYETVLKRGRGLSIDAGINFGPANDALLLAAGYLNDLYMLVGNEAYADAANPTIGIGTKDGQYGDIATSLFAFRGQVPTLLEEELGLLRGRDDVALPGVEIAPVYNRMIWNYTRGIDAGEVIYALNYNILDQNTDGRVDAADAARLFPQGHGDAYGHYLTAVKGYYSLLMNPSFDWVPRIEAVNILGKPVTVDYLDERKFAAAAAALARTGRQILELTWRKDYQPRQGIGWEHFATNRVSARTYAKGSNSTNVVRDWGVDHWASRAMRGAVVNWVVANSILPDVDPDPSHEGIQKVDRTTVPELKEIAATVAEIQTVLDNAEGQLTPLGLPEGALTFDLDPTLVTASGGQTHFEQIYSRAAGALNNSLAAFDDAKNVTSLMRAESDSLYELQTALAEQETAFTNALIEIYGSPYPDDVGPGKTFKQGYEGPDLVHYMYVEHPQVSLPNEPEDPNADTFLVDFQKFPASWIAGGQTGAGDFGFLQLNSTRAGSNYVSYTLSPLGYPEKPGSWAGKRRSPGELQQAIAEVLMARDAVSGALGDAQDLKRQLDAMIRVYTAGIQANSRLDGIERDLAIAEQVAATAERASELFGTVQESIKSVAEAQQEALVEAFPRSLIAGLAAGGDVTSSARALLRSVKGITKGVVDGITIARTAVTTALRTATDAAAAGMQNEQVKPLERTQERREALLELDGALMELQGAPDAINAALLQYEAAQRQVAALVAKGERLQQEREVFRQRTAAIVQGFRTRDAAFRIFRNEKLERYKTLFELSSRYAFMAATAFDYETGLLNTEKGRGFINRIVSSRALGVVRDGQPQYAGSNSGDPGISSALAEMKADWDVLRGRLGFNSPDVAATLVSFRTENLRILPGDSGLTAWQDYLLGHQRDNVLEDPDVRRYCLQGNRAASLPVPGIIITFSTTIEPGLNLFGRQLAAGDSALHHSSFATKLHALGVAFPGYRGMNTPGHNSAAVNYAIGSGTNTVAGDPSMAYLDPTSLAATPYIYLVPVGTDSMRSPPLGDTGDIRTWTVNDVAIPLPFNIGGSGFSSHRFYQSADSLTEPLFAIRKHPAFRPVDSSEPFNDFTLDLTPYTSRRLIGRSVWNSQWKLVIPGDALLNDPKEGLSRFIRTVTDIQLYFSTYSYAGN